MAEEKDEMSFRDLGVNEQLSGACENFGWKNPTKIQVEAITVGLAGKDIIGLAQTGSGKTGAFAIPILQSLLLNPLAIFFACVLSPTRELAIQIAELFEALGSGIGVKCAVLVGGVDMGQQSIALGKRPHIVVATPGRLVDHLTNTKGFSLRTLKYLSSDHPYPRRCRTRHPKTKKEGAEVVGVFGGEMVASVDDFFHHATAILAPADGDESRYFASLLWDFRRYYGRV